MFGYDYIYEIYWYHMCFILVFNRDVIRARLKMTLIARNLQFAEAVLGTCHYYNYTDDDLVPRVQHLQLVISKQKGILFCGTLKIFIYNPYIKMYLESDVHNFNA